MKNLKIFISVFVAIFAISLVSAGWFTGYAIKSVLGDPAPEVGTNVGRCMGIGDLCSDSDGGVKPYEAGLLLIWSAERRFSKPTRFYDVCGKSKAMVYDSKGNLIPNAFKVLKEYYSDSDGKPAHVYYDKDDLGEGYCLKKKEKIDGVKKKYGRWVPHNICVDVGDKGIKFTDESGIIRRNGCYSGNFITYGCDPDSKEVVEISNEDCAALGEYGRCENNNGCVGSCFDTDVENDKNIPGVVIRDGVEYLDKCNKNDNKVKQYYCKKGNVKVKQHGSKNNEEWEGCGKDRLCVVDEDTGAGKCISKTVAAETTSLKGLKRVVSSLEARIEALESVLDILVGHTP